MIANDLVGHVWVEVIRRAPNHGSGIFLHRPARLDVPSRFDQFHHLEFFALFRYWFFTVRTIAFVPS